MYKMLGIICILYKWLKPVPLDIIRIIETATANQHSCFHRFQTRFSLRSSQFPIYRTYSIAKGVKLWYNNNVCNKLTLECEDISYE